MPLYPLELQSKFTEFIADLRGGLSEDLPGIIAQKRMAPIPDIQKRFDVEGRKKARKSAVMILLYQEQGRVKFPLIVRQEYPGVHSGQIALPGGKHEPTDSDLIHTAQRETSEEIGIPLQEVEILGKLSELFVPPSNFNILPVIGFLKNPPIFKLEEKEVKRLIIVDHKDLTNPALRKQKMMTFFNKTDVEVPYFDIQDQVVWGATAMILSELASIIKNINAKKRMS